MACLTRASAARGRSERPCRAGTAERQHLRGSRSARAGSAPSAGVACLTRASAARGRSERPCRAGTAERQHLRGSRSARAGRAPSAGGRSERRCCAGTAKCRSRSVQASIAPSFAVGAFRAAGSR